MKRRQLNFQNDLAFQRALIALSPKMVLKKKFRDGKSPTLGTGPVSQHRHIVVAPIGDCQVDITVAVKIPWDH